MGDPEEERDNPAEPAPNDAPEPERPKSDASEPGPPKVAEPKPIVLKSKDFSDDDSARETVPAQRLRARLQEENASVIVDPSIVRVEVSERQRLATERFADRARYLALACFISAGLMAIVIAVSLSGRIEPGVLFFLLPTGIANVVIGVLFRRAAESLTRSMLPKQLDEKPMVSAFDDLSTAFGVQTVATGLFAALLLVLLMGALLVRRVAEL